MEYLAFFLALAGLLMVFFTFAKINLLNSRIYEVSSAISALKHNMGKFETDINRELNDLRTDAKPKLAQIKISRQTKVRDILEVLPFAAKALTSLEINLKSIDDETLEEIAQKNNLEYDQLHKELSKNLDSN